MKCSNFSPALLGFYLLFQLLAPIPTSQETFMSMRQSTSAPPQSNKGTVSFSRSSARWQRGAPIQLVTLGGQAPDLLDAIVLNVGGQSVRSLRLGCYLTGKTGRAKTPRQFLFMHTEEIVVNIEPGRAATIISPKWVVDRKDTFSLDAKGATEVVAVYGIIGATYEGRRSPFTYDLLRKRRFDATPSKQIETLYLRAEKEGRLKESLSRLDSAPAQQVIGGPPLRDRWECYPAINMNCRIGAGGSTCNESECAKNDGPCRNEACREIPREPRGGNGGYCPLPNYPTMCFPMF